MTVRVPRSMIPILYRVIQGYMGLYGDNGKENGNYYSISGVSHHGRCNLTLEISCA